MRIQIKILFLLLALSLQAQDKLDLSKALKVGQELPVLPFFPVLNYQSLKIDWGEIKDKVIILDFFDTFCSNCIRDMPKLQKLQDELSDKLQIVLVTWQDKETIEKLYANNAYLKKNKVHLPTIYGDTLLKAYFPHKGVPHTAWLFQNKVQAITFADFSKVEYVKMLYEDGSIELPLKNDFQEVENISISSGMDARKMGFVELTGYKDGDVRGGLQVKYDSVNNTTIATIGNMDILGAYTSSWVRLKKPEYILKEGRIVWKVKDPDSYKYRGKGERNIWLLDHAVNYKRVDPFLRSEKDVAKLVLNDLSNFLGLNVYWDMQKINCLVLQKTDNWKEEERDTLKTSNIETSDLLTFLIDYNTTFPPVFDEVKAAKKMYITEYSGVDSLNKQLAKYGMVLVEGVREMEVLVFEEVM